MVQGFSRIHWQLSSVSASFRGIYLVLWCHRSHGLDIFFICNSCGTSYLYPILMCFSISFYTYIYIYTHTHIYIHTHTLIFTKSIYISYIMISFAVCINTTFHRKENWGSEMLNKLTKDPKNISIWTHKSRKHNLKSSGL